MKKKRKLGRKLLSFLLTLALVVGLMPGMGLTAYAASTTVTWNASDITNQGGGSFTKDGITITFSYVDWASKDFSGPGTFTTESGKFTNIEVTASEKHIGGTGWSSGTWTGEPSSSVSYSGDITELKKIVFTIETADEKTKETTPTTTFTATGADAGTLSGVTDGMKYSLDGTNWTDISSSTAINLTGLSAGSIQVVKKGNGTTTIDSDPQSITVTKAETPNLTVTQPTVVGGKGTVATTTSHEYSNDNGNTWTTCTANQEFEAGTYLIRVKASGTVLASGNQTVNVKAFQTAPAGLTATKASSSTAADGKISGVTSAMEYQKDGDTSWTAVGNGKTEITGLTAGTYKVRYAGTADKNASDATSVEVGVKEDQTAPTGLTATKASSSTATDGKISGVTAAMEYQIDGASTWTAVGNGKTEITGLTAGTYKVRYAGTADKNASDATSVEVGVKVAPTVTAPTAKNLTYNGQKQELVNAGSTEDGTLYYAVTTENTAPTDDNLYTTSIPAKTEAGTYYVWYKVKGDKDHLDSEPVCVEAAIAKRNVTLTSAEDSKDYDGKPLTNNNITVTGDGWAEGEGATYNVTGTQTLPGASDNGFTYTLNNNTKESNYNISKVINKLTVNDRTEKYEINVEVNSDNVTYDGNEHEVSGFKTLEFLCDDVTYTVSGLSASVIGTDAGTYDVVVTGTPLVKNSDDKDLTKQFIVNIVPGQLVIDTRNVSFTSASETKQYDGEPLTNDNVEITGDGFAEGEGASFDVTGNQLVVGSSANTFTYTLNEGTNPDNYSITSQEGTLTVTNRLAKYEIIPKANSGEFTYDGSEHSVTGFVTDTFEVATDDETTHIYTLSGLTAEGIGTDVGEYTVNITGTPVVIDAEGNDVSSEFSVTPVAGNIVINKRNVTLTSASDSKAYDGKELTNAEVTVSGDGWAEGEGAEYKVTGTRKLPGETRNSFTYTLNEGTNADNYEITSVEGILTITDRKAEDEEGSDKDVRYEITVVANSGNFTYDGTEHEVSGIESTEFIINDVTYTVSGLEASAKGTEVGTYPVKISGTPVVTDADGNDLTKQFTVYTKGGSLTVVEKTVNPEGDIRYSNYSGDRAVWTKGSNAGCEFVFKRSVDDELTFGHFTGIDVESKAVDASNYTAVSGSVVITLKPEYLETLAVGDHLLTANFDDGNSVTVKFTIKEKSEEKKSDTTLNNKKADVTPETGDTVNVQLIFLVMVLSMCVIFVLCNLRSKLDEKKRRR